MALKRALKPATSDPQRRALYAKLSIAQKQLGLDEDTFRDILEQKTGHRSRTEISTPQLMALIDHFKTLGFRAVSATKAPKRAATTDWQRKVTALWLALYWLGVVTSRSDKARDAFVARQTGVATLRWLTADQASSVIDALKDIAAREAGVDWRPFSGWVQAHGMTTPQKIDRPKVRVLEAQFRILKYDGSLGAWLTAHGYGDIKKPQDILSEAADRAMAHLGAEIRAKGKA